MFSSSGVLSGLVNIYEEYKCPEKYEGFVSYNTLIKNCKKFGNGYNDAVEKQTTFDLIKNKNGKITINGFPVEEGLDNYEVEIKSNEEIAETLEADDSIIISPLLLLITIIITLLI